MIIVNGELTLALFALIGAVVGYLVSHFLTLRENSVIREFEMRKEGKDLYLPLYGYLAKLVDLVIAYVIATEKGKAQVIIEKGYKYLKPKEIVKIFKETHENFTRFLGESRTKGYELFVPPKLSRIMEDILGYSDFLYEEGKWNERQRDIFVRPAVTAMDEMEELLGLKRKGLPKWLKPRLWKSKLEEWFGRS